MEDTKKERECIEETVEKPSTPSTPEKIDKAALVAEIRGQRRKQRKNVTQDETPTEHASFERCDSPVQEVQEHLDRDSESELEAAYPTSDRPLYRATVVGYCEFCGEETPWEWRIWRGERRGTWSFDHCTFCGCPFDWGHVRSPTHEVMGWEGDDIEWYEVVPRKNSESTPTSELRGLAARTFESLMAMYGAGRFNYEGHIAVPWLTHSDASDRLIDLAMEEVSEEDGYFYYELTRESFRAALARFEHVTGGKGYAKRTAERRIPDEIRAKDPGAWVELPSGRTPSTDWVRSHDRAMKDLFEGDPSLSKAGVSRVAEALWQSIVPPDEEVIQYLLDGGEYPFRL